ncbi:hypothetical protein GOB94_10945 [Granulicella sp. 5B5]|uniref:hypothetical protein n=1 Tax=Granulicella sp. 5B5 TaxID=1617967 RepID=UPI0015F59220|nr:hypothetical protein [Granulicella sp. 5B5]QMV19133.1 hypothetical protein GOB94_10945 [Granulicella sp. 5B5]
MRRTLTHTAAIALVTLPFTAAAQTAMVQAEVTNPSQQQSSCPVGFRAQLTTTPGTVIVDSGTHAAISQQVQLTIKNPGGLGITSLRVIVHGLTPQPHTTPVVATGSGSSGIIDTPATLRLGVAPGADGYTQLGIKGITSIRSIDLTQVTYVGGTTWEATPGHTCHIEPNRVMLVATR